MTTWKKVHGNAEDCRIIIRVSRRDDGVVVAHLFSGGPFGVLPMTGADGDEMPILESLDRAADHVGPKGTVCVDDPSDLWAPEWPTLT